ncbi:MAG: SAM-dependent methyltransferase [Corynebacterium sp.]|nr:SAM-dependent methyltransferase [Corynebacterium sp.]
MGFNLAEIAFLAAHREEIAEVTAQCALTKATVLADGQRLRAAFGEMGRAVSELTVARRLAAAKGLNAQWLWTKEAAEQATPGPVVAVRHGRIASFAPGEGVWDVTCSVGTELANYGPTGSSPVDFPVSSPVCFGSDIDPVRVAMARINLTTPGIFCADARAPAIPAAAAPVIIADPARRAGGRRITRPEDLHPPLPDLVATYSDRLLAIKCAPGLNYSAWEGLASVVSVNGAVKELCLYSPGLAAGDCRREAVVIHTETDGGWWIDRITDTAPDAVDSGPLGSFLIDPDGAIVRAGLVRHFAARENLHQLDPHIAYLTGESIPAGYSGFPVREVVPVKKLTAAVRALQITAAEILVRGVDVDPVRLRGQLKLRSRAGSGGPAGIIITRIGQERVAVICGLREFNPRPGSG